jgi:hypothetical protein
MAERGSGRAALTAPQAFKETFGGNEASSQRAPSTTLRVVPLPRFRLRA